MDLDQEKRERCVMEIFTEVDDHGYSHVELEVHIHAQKPPLFFRAISRNPLMAISYAVADFAALLAKGAK